MADQDDEGGPRLATPPGGDDASFGANALGAAVSTVPSLPVSQGVRAVRRMFGGPKRDNIPD
jgi:hypothetical protein